MKINICSTLLNGNRFPTIVSESEIDYSGIDSIINPKDIYDLVNYLFKASSMCEEHMYIITLNQKNKVIGIFDSSHGTLSEATVHPREIFIRAILCQSSSIICVHNHPSGNSRPSSNDIECTTRISKAGNIIGINLLDHIIVGDGEFTSMRQEGLI